MTDVDAITLSSLRLFNLGQLSEQQTVTAIALAVLANLAFKFGMVVFIGGWALARQVAAGFGAIACGCLWGCLRCDLILNNSSSDLPISSQPSSTSERRASTLQFEQMRPTAHSGVPIEGRWR